MHVTEVRYLADYRIWLAFNDGAAGEVDLAPELYGDLFEPLKDPARFRASETLYAEGVPEYQ